VRDSIPSSVDGRAADESGGRAAGRALANCFGRRRSRTTADGAADGHHWNRRRAPLGQGALVTTDDFSTPKGIERNIFLINQWYLWINISQLHFDGFQSCKKYSKK
jgi:hypothetical protein